ncbi:sulfotransferase [Streptomyces sp. DSM 44917]|uniref:Sulfotransferase n=1 Tax=Streptomyces boetiae TaxID=3075541 RepID=A0ABU2L5C9_9ACTN|nr:sulfotransferase [Streptomyces sp. DSM 44917]MDT0306770.1 sulfotransferase [Streptomyces sp. DSM 44917]
MTDTGAGTGAATAAAGTPEPGPVFVFIGGLHRSGTTPLARALATHPQVSGFSETGAKEDEGQYLQTVYRPAAERTRSGPGRFALSPAAHMTEDSPLARPENRERLIAEWGRHWDLGRPFLVEKSPANLMMTRFLQHLFPEARFVVIARHPVIVTLSTKKWAPRTRLSTLFENWFRAHDTLRADAPRVARLHTLSYENLVARPEETLEGVRAFLGLDGPIAAGSVQDRSGPYRERWEAMARASDPLGRRRFRSLCERFEARANAYGYSLLDLDRVPPPSAP